MSKYWDSIHLRRLPDDDAPRLPRDVFDTYRAFVACGMVNAIATTAAITDPGSQAASPPLFLCLFHAGAGYYLGAFIVADGQMEFAPLLTLPYPPDDPDEVIAVLEAASAITKKIADICYPLPAGMYLSRIYIGQPESPERMATAESIAYLADTTMLALADTTYDAEQAELMEKDLSSFPYLAVGRVDQLWFVYAGLGNDRCLLGAVTPPEKPETIEKIRQLAEEYFSSARNELDTGSEWEYN